MPVNSVFHINFSIICDRGIESTSPEGDSAVTDGDMPIDQSKNAHSFSVGKVNTFPTDTYMPHRWHKHSLGPKPSVPGFLASIKALKLHQDQWFRGGLTKSVKKLSFAMFPGVLDPPQSSGDQGSLPACP